MIGKTNIVIVSPKDEKDKSFSVLVEGKKYDFDKFKDCPITIGRGNAILNEVICIKDCESTKGTFFVVGEKCSFVYLLSDLTFKIFDNKFTVKLSYD